MRLRKGKKVLAFLLVGLLVLGAIPVYADEQTVTEAVYGDTAPQEDIAPLEDTTTSEGTTAPESIDTSEDATVQSDNTASEDNNTQQDTTPQEDTIEANDSTTAPEDTTANPNGGNTSGGTTVPSDTSTPGNTDIPIDTTLPGNTTGETTQPGDTPTSGGSTQTGGTSTAGDTTQTGTLPPATGDSTQTAPTTPTDTTGQTAPGTQPTTPALGTGIIVPQPIVVMEESKLVNAVTDCVGIKQLIKTICFEYTIEITNPTEYDTVVELVNIEAVNSWGIVPFTENLNKKEFFDKKIVQLDLEGVSLLEGSNDVTDLDIALGAGEQKTVLLTVQIPPHPNMSIKENLFNWKIELRTIPKPIILPIVPIAPSPAAPTATIVPPTTSTTPTTGVPTVIPGAPPTGTPDAGASCRLAF